MFVLVLLSEILSSFCFFFFFFNDTATTEIYTLSLHDALPICIGCCFRLDIQDGKDPLRRREGLLDGIVGRRQALDGDRKSTRLNSSHGYISYAVFCLKKKKNNRT